MEYEQSPSGYVTMNRYKEPFMPYEGGHGYRGILLYDGKTDKVQCHECGEWFGYLPNHLRKEHNMRARQYKERVGLRQTTALISETNRKKLIKNGLKARMKNLRPGGKQSEETKQKIRETLKNKTDEKANETGTCPLQLLDRLIKLHDKLGRTPSQKEITFYDALVNEHGDMKTACMRAGIPYRKPGQNINNPQWKYNKKEIKKAIYKYWEKNKTLPLKSHFKNGMKNRLYKDYRGYKWIDLLHKSLNSDGIMRCKVPYYKYSPEEMLTFLRKFKETHNRVPRPSDARRGLLPGVDAYYRTFGSFVEARKQAGIIDDE